jgi:hypothetical protein
MCTMFSRTDDAMRPIVSDAYGWDEVPWVADASTARPPKTTKATRIRGLLMMPAPTTS